jgi:hypothetical protein
MTVAGELLERNIGGDGQAASVRRPKLLQLSNSRQALSGIAAEGSLHITWET